MSADCRLTVTVRPARDAEEVAAARELRVRIFCDEQGVDHEEEFDEFEEESTQVVARDESGVIATCRLRRVEADCKLERMAVERRLRRLGVGSRLLGGAEAVAREWGCPEIVLHAQMRAQEFYASEGYAAEGERFIEAGIEHVRMRKQL